VSDQQHSWTGWRRLPFRPITPGAARAFVFLSVLTVLLSAAAYYFSVRAVQGEIASRASVVQLCQASNESRAQQVTLWTHLIAISQPPPHETAAQKRQRQATTREFLAYVRTVFAPRDCAGRFSG
jgi:hypothetical protein